MSFKLYFVYFIFCLMLYYCILTEVYIHCILFVTCANFFSSCLQLVSFIPLLQRFSLCNIFADNSQFDQPKRPISVPRNSKMPVKTLKINKTAAGLGLKLEHHATAACLNGKVHDSVVCKQNLIAREKANRK